MDETGSKIEPFIISRTFNAPRDVIWKAWTEPGHIKNWWGPKGSKVFSATVELRLGGMNHYCLITSEGEEVWGKQVYREIMKPERLVFVNSFSDPSGGITRHPKAPNWPQELMTTITFKDENRNTKVTVEWIPMNPTEEERKAFDYGRQGMKQGWSGSLDQLEQYLPKIL